MAQCELCGNDYDKSFEVVAAGATHTFYCCAHCARHAEDAPVSDRA
ncbi:hypothetical protein [Janibacter sp. Soil728]|nr:hypothetical protein [Janibacter sp. Soil728]